MSNQSVIDQWVTKMLSAEASLHGLQLDLLDLRKDGPHGQRPTAKNHLTLCRLARGYVQVASSKVRSLHIGGAI